MIPRVGRQGSSFKGASLYYLHPKNAEGPDRVAFTETRNLPTDDPDIGWRVMAHTAMDADRLKHEAGVDRRGAKTQKPVWTLSLSWHPEQQPTREQMTSAMDRALEYLGLADRQVYYVAHNDEPHPHIHAIVNLVHPENGRSASLKYSKEKLSKWAEGYEREHDQRIYCEQRVENNARRDAERRRRAFNRASGREGEKAAYPRHQYPELDLKAEITRRYQMADSGKAFRASVAELGFTIAQGRRIVLVGPDGKQYNLVRQVEGAKTKDIQARLKDIELPPLDDARQQQQEEHARGQQEERSQERPRSEEPEYFDRDQQERQADERIIDGAIEHQKAGVLTGLHNRQQDAHLAQLGALYDDSQQRRHRLAATLDAQYGKHERAIRASIDDLEARMQGAGRFRIWLMKVTGQLPRTAETDLQNHRRTLASIEQRKDEMTAALERDIDDRRRELEDRQQHERDNAPRDLEPRELDPLARSIERQQQEASNAYLGAAAPAETGMGDAQAISPASDGFSDAGGDISGGYSGGSVEHEGPSMSHEG